MHTIYICVQMACDDKKKNTEYHQTQTSVEVTVEAFGMGCNMKKYARCKPDNTSMQCHQKIVMCRAAMMMEREIHAVE